MNELMPLLAQVLLAWLVVLGLGRLLGYAFGWLGQPPVIGEIAAGIMLGPSLLGWVWPSSARLFSPDVLSVVGQVAHIGLVLYLFCLGLELDFDQIRARGKQTVLIAAGCMLAPFLAGSGLSFLLFEDFAGAVATPQWFAVFMGVAFAITAFPVLARMLSDRRWTFTDLGQTALVCAALCDLAAWCLLAVLSSAATGVSGGWYVVVGAALFVAGMLLVAKPLLSRLAHWQTTGWLSLLGPLGVLLALVAATGIAAWIGIHAMIGAFLCGLVVPRESDLAGRLGRWIERYANPVLLPTFFAVSGFRAELGLLNSATAWAWSAAIIFAAAASKMLGTYAAARCGGQSRHDALGLAVLMNTRGLMELIVLNLALELQLINAALFAAMLLMALATTLMTGPLLHILKINPASAALLRQPSAPTASHR